MSHYFFFQAMLLELKSIAGVLERNRSELRQTERQLKEAKTKVEEARYLRLTLHISYNFHSIFSHVMHEI